MFKIKERFFITIYRIIDIVVVGLSFLVAFHLRKNISLPFLELFDKSFGDYLWHLLALLFIWWYLLYFNKVYIPYRGNNLKKIILAILKASVQGLFLIGFILFFIHEFEIHRTLIIIFILLSFGLLSLEKYFVFRFLRYIRKLDKNIKYVLIIGTGKRAVHLLHLFQTQDIGLRVIGLLGDGPGIIGKKLKGIPIIGLSEDLRDILQRNVVDEVFIALSTRHTEEIQKILVDCEQFGINARIMVQVHHPRKASVYIDELFGLPFYTVTVQPLKVYQLYLKGIIDVIGAFMLMVFLSPLFLVIAVLIKLESKGPIFYRQDRIGVNGRKFVMYKFRSMVENAETLKSQLENLNEMSGPVFKIRNDPRVTKIGKWIRKTSLDELPQLLNVLRLEMSLVGPRPLPIDEANKIIGMARRRLSMKPGMTGLWQVSGRSKINFDKWMEFDLGYIDEWSLSLDVKILLKTLMVWLSGKGAY